MRHMANTTRKTGHISTPTNTELTSHVATPVPMRPEASTWMPMTIMMISQGML